MEPWIILALAIVIGLLWYALVLRPWFHAADRRRHNWTPEGSATTHKKKAS